MSSHSKCARTMEKLRWSVCAGMRPGVDEMMGSQSLGYGGAEVEKPRRLSYACVEWSGLDPRWWTEVQGSPLESLELGIGSVNGMHPK